MKRALVMTAALVAAVVVSAVLLLPPAPLTLSPGWSDGTVPGVLHVHTNRSDGRSSPDEVAAAAARAGLKFLVFTDHGDATRTPDPPAYRSGVLCLDGVEISTNGGHYVALDMPPSPYPLAGEPRDVVDDVRRLGGFGIAAHPDSPKQELRWRDWDLPIDAVEIINPDTSWRRHAAAPGWRPKLTLARALLTYPVRGGATIASLLTAPHLVEWNRLTATRRVAALAGVDAHAKLELRNVDPGDNRYSLPVPSYDASFHVLTVHAEPDAPFNGDAAADARSLIGALRKGHAYIAVDAWAGPPAFEFTATNAGGSAAAGDLLAPNGPTTLHVRSNAPADGASIVTVRQNGMELVSGSWREKDVNIGAMTGAFTVDVRIGDRPDGPAWVTSNPIYVRAADTPAPPRARVPAAASAPLFDGRTLAHWNTEADRTSLAALDVAPRLSGSEIRLRYGLSGGSNIGQFATATVDTPEGIAKFDRITFAIRAERPMRISVQVRAAVAGAAPERWQRSIYVDADERVQTVFFDDMTPVGKTHTQQVPLADVRNFLFLIDTTNTRPGSSGRVWLRDLRLEQGGSASP